MIPAGKYILFGRTGIGKSSLINTISQSSLSVTDNAYSCTKSIAKYQFQTPAGLFEIWDSPGFCEDENPDTDKKYYNVLCNFFDYMIPIGEQYSIILTVRLGAKRIKSEDFEIVRYLAMLVRQYQLSVFLVATWADFSAGGEQVRELLDTARIQYISMLDSELLCSTLRQVCASPFHGSYAVDNISGTWLSSWHKIISPVHNTKSYKDYEGIIGHTEIFIRNWIHLAGHSTDSVLSMELANLLNARILNLTRQGGIVTKNLPDFVSVFPSPNAKVIPWLRVNDDALAIELNSIQKRISQAFNFETTKNLHIRKVNLDSDLSFYIRLLRPSFSSRGGNKLTCSYMVALLAGRQMLLAFNIIIARRNIITLDSQTLTKRIAIFREILVITLQRLENGYLANELLGCLSVTLDIPTHHDFEVVALHLQNSSGLLYAITLIAERVCYAGHSCIPSISRWSLGLRDVADWIEENACPFSYISLIPKMLREGNLDAIEELALTSPICISALLLEITRCLKNNPWLISQGQMEAIRDRN